MNKNTVYLSFHGEINPTSATNLVYVCNKVVQDGAKHIYLLLSSRGGLTDSGFFLYNILKSLNAEITTHNTGSVESAGFVAFLAGKNRIASEVSRFLVHQPIRKFPANTSYDARDLSEFAQLLESDQLNIKKVFQNSTTATSEEIDTWFKLSKIFTPAEAKSHGIITDICEFNLSGTENIITISTEAPMEKNCVFVSTYY